MINRNPPTDWVALLSILALFPGSFFYQVLVGIGALPPFAGGYFGLVCAGLFVILGSRFSLTILLSGRIRSFDAAYFSFILYFIGVALLNVAMKRTDEYLVWHLVSAVQCATVYLIFRGLFERTIATKRLTWLAVSGMTFCIFFFMENGVFSIRSISQDSENISSYQGFALAYLLTCILAIYNTNSRLIRILAYIPISYALYVNGARSEFVAFLIFSCSFEICKSNLKLASIVFALFFVGMTSALLYSGMIELPDNRVSRLLDLSEDNSSLVRNQLVSQGITKIAENPLFGDYGSYEKGYYIHNILSAWIDLGLIGFLYLVLLVSIPLIILSRDVLLKGRSSNTHAMLISSIFACSILLIFGKYFTYLMLPAVLGLYSQYKPSQIRTIFASDHTSSIDADQ